MKSNLHLASRHDWSDADLETLNRLMRLRESLKAFGDGPPEQPKRYRARLLNFDFWFMFAAMIQLFLIFTSFIPTNMFEPLAAGSFVCCWLALISNLNREKVELPPKSPRKHRPLIVLNFNRVTPSLRELQVAHGVKVAE